uniref:P2 family phage major capsid protein n=1 Tax=Chromobacterium haemolyticum TaxID=394935 RepID=UPI001962A534
MKTETRNVFTQLLDQIARLNGVTADAVKNAFSVQPSIQQKLETRIQESGSAASLRAKKGLPAGDDAAVDLRLVWMAILGYLPWV